MSLIVKPKKNRVIILGAGMTGLAAGFASGFPIYEANEVPGGICSSYYMQPESDARLYTEPKDKSAYRFELGGGHWIFGASKSIISFIRSFVPIKSYLRKSAVYLSDHDVFIPYPIQYNLRYLDKATIRKILREIRNAKVESGQTMADWLLMTFGPTLYEIFFEPFHRMYTAGLWKSIAPQDTFKTPPDVRMVLKGAFGRTPVVGYNTTFIYPKTGLDHLARRLASKCKVMYSKEVVHIDVENKCVRFVDDSIVNYKFLISTLPLNKMMKLTQLEIDEKEDPWTSVLVVNIGGIKGRRCPTEHWIYFTKSSAGFHRVGFYSNVDKSFLPKQRWKDGVSMYIEKAYLGGKQPLLTEKRKLCLKIIRELQELEWITTIEACDVTWVDTAYTWQWPNSKWSTKAIELLNSYSIYQVGRYARWKFQGIAESIKDGLESIRYTS